MKLFELPNVQTNTATIANFLETYMELRELVSKSKTMTKKEKTEAFNTNDENLKLMTDSYFNTILSALINAQPKTIEVKDEHSNIVSHDLYQWYQYIPASTKYHDVENGGLYHHSQKLFYNWVKSLLQMKCDYPIEKACVIALIHDFCKLTHYYYSHDDHQWHNIYPETYHHAIKSLEIAKEIGIEITPDMEALVLMHMSGFQNEEDKLAMSLEAKNWLYNLDNIQILQLLNCADCK